MFFLSLIWAWTAWNLYRPHRGKPELLTVLGFMFGFLVGELGLHFIAIEVLITLLIISFGELSGLGDALGLAISMASWVAIALFYFRARRAQPVMEQAVKYALGLTADAPLPDQGVITHEPDLQRLLNPFAFKHPGVERVSNIEYGRVEGRALHVDIYRPVETVENAPVLFQIHGGAWLEKAGSKEQQALPLMSQLAANGWVCVSVQYRLSPGATFPDHIIDCKRALAWTKTHIAEYGGNPDFVIATGGSAGGHLSSLLALSANAAEFQPGFEEVDTSVQGCVPLYGFYDFLNLKGQRTNYSTENWILQKLFKKTQSEAPELWKSGCPASWVSDNAPPFLLIHGEQDSLVPASESQNLYEDLMAVSKNPVAYAELPDAQHAFDLAISLRSQIVVNALCIYLCEMHRRYQNDADVIRG